MANKREQIVMDLELRVENAIKEADKLRERLDKTSPKLGEGFSRRFIGEVNNVRNALNKLQLKVPGANATEKEMINFGKSIDKVVVNMKRIGESAKVFNVTTDYVKDNISGLEEYEKKLDEVQKKLGKLRASHATNEDRIGEVSQRFTTAQNTGGMRSINKQMREIAADKRNVGSDSEGYEAIKKLYAAARDSGKFTAEQLKELSTAEQGYLGVIRKRADLQEKTNAVQIQENEILAQGQRQFIDNQEEVVQEILRMIGGLQEAGGATRNAANEFKNLEGAGRSVDMLTSRIEYMFSTFAIFQKIGQVVRQAINDFKELDKQFNDIAIVSQYSTKEMWESFSTVNKMAQEYGVTTSNVVAVQNLYYHQGKKMAEVNELTAETLTLAKITGMDYEDATNKMTAALNAYKIEAQDAAQVTDTVAALSANAATSSQELMTALTKTASIAANAGMSLENTEVFLTKMIETTREAPENLGTALKTIVARFGEVKQEIDGEVIDPADINKVDTALKSVGVSLLDSAGQVRDLDDVFMELSAKWDDLDRNTQRYIATQAAGARQQSRFIAMMENYDRTLELTEVAQNSAGTGQRQLAKSMESINSAADRLKSSWQELYATFVKSGQISGIYNTLNSLVTALNKMTKTFGSGATLVTVAVTGLIVKYVLFDKVLKGMIDRYKVLIGVQQIETYVEKRQAAAQKGLFGSTKLFIENLKKLTAADRSLIKARLGNIAVLKTSKAATMEDTASKITAKLIDEGIIEQKEKEAAKQEILNALKKKSTSMTDKEAAAKVFDTLASKNLVKAESEEAAVTAMTSVATDADSVAKEGNTFAALINAAANTTLLATYWPLLVVLGVVAVAAAAVGVAMLKSAIHMKKARKEIDGATEALDNLSEMKEKFNEKLSNIRDFEKNLKTIEEYSDRTLLTSDEQEQLQEAMNAIAEEYPSLIDYYDEAGNAVLLQNDALKEQLKLLKQEAEVERKNVASEETRLAKLGIGEGSGKDRGKATTTAMLSNLGISESDPKEAAKQWGKEQSNLDKEETRDQIIALSSSAAAGALAGGNVPVAVASAIAGAIDLGLNELGVIEEINDVVYDIQMGDVDDRNKALIESYQSGIGMTQGLSGEIFGEDLTEAQYEEWIKIVSENGYDLTSGVQMQHSLADLFGVSLKDSVNNAQIQAMMDKYYEVDSQIMKAVAADVSQQGEQLKQSYRNSLYMALELDEEDLGITNEQAGKFADIFSNVMNAEFSEEDALNQIKSYTKEQREAILKGVDLSDVKLEEYYENGELDFDAYVTKSLGISAENAPQLHDAMVKYLENNVTYTPEDLENIARALGTNVDELFNLTGAEIAARKKVRDQIMSVTDDEAETATRFKAIDSILDGNAEAWRGISKAADGTTDGLYDAALTMTKAGISSDDTATALMHVSGGLDGLPLKNAAELATTLKKKLTNLKDSLEEINNLSKGEGTFESVEKLMSLMGDIYEGEDLISKLQLLDKSLQFNADGSIGLDSDFVGLLTGDYNSSINSVSDTLLKLAESKLAAKAVELANATEEEKEQLQAEYEELYKSVILLKAFAKAGKGAIDDVGDSLNKAKESAEALTDALRELYNWLLEIDRFMSLDNARDRLDKEFGDLEYQINFTTNADNVADAYEKQLNNLGNQMAAALAGKEGAKKNLQSLADAIKNTDLSKYLSIDDSGALFYNYETIEELQRKISESSKIPKDATDKQKEVLNAQKQYYQDQYDAIMDTANAYNEILDKVDEYDDALQGIIDKYKEIENQLLQNVIDLQDEVIKVIQAEEDKEVKLTKEKYDKIKQENNEYLDSVQKMIDKERQMRDNAQRDEDLKKKERKLAMMKMDTSGVYASDIASLEDELASDYQDREDRQVDQMMNDLKEFYTTQASAYDKQIEYMENTIEAHRETMTYYYEEFKEVINGTTDEIVEYLETHSEEYQKASSERKQQMENEWRELAAKGKGSAKELGTSLYDQVIEALRLAQEETGTLEDAIDVFAKNAVADNETVRDSVAGITTKFKDLVSYINNSVVTAFVAMKKAADDALKAAQDAASYTGGSGSTEESTTNPSKGIVTAERTSNGHREVQVNGHWYDNQSVGGGHAKVGEEASIMPGAQYVDDHIADPPKTETTATSTPGSTIKETKYRDVINYVGNGKNTGTATLSGSWYVADKEGKYVDFDTSWDGITEADLVSKGVLVTAHAREYGGAVGGEEKFVRARNVWNGDVRFVRASAVIGNILPAPGRLSVDEGCRLYHNKIVREAYAKGGIVDYTGPAWVDGTKSNPEAFLSATDTKNIAALRDVLALTIGRGANYDMKTSNSSLQNITFNIEVNVEQMANDYDLNSAISKIEDKITSAAQYRNINILKKSK